MGKEAVIQGVVILHPREQAAAGAVHILVPALLAVENGATI